MKIVAALWQPDVAGLLGAELRRLLHGAGVGRWQVNVDDEHIPDGALRIQHFDEALTCVVSLWGPVGALDLLTPYAERVAAWEVEERVPLEPPPADDGVRLDGLAQVAFLRRPAELAYDAWQRHWHGPHSEVAMATQATFGYVQNRVLRPLTDDAPEVDAIVEELFPTAAMHDVHAFYGSGGSDEELSRRITRLMESVAVMGADRDLDVVATSRYVFGD